MKNFDFPVFKTKTEGVTKKFNLNDPDERREYFSAKAGPEIAAIRKYLESGKAFIAHLLGKKNSGKGTYSKLFMEAIGDSHVGHVAVGDIVRDVHAGLSDPARKNELSAFLAKHYRGFHSLEEIDGLIEGRSQSTLVSSELIIALLKYEISKRPRQAIFIDGFPRGLDQVNYSIFLRELLGYHGEPDFFVFIDVPDAVIDERIKARVVCPVCKTPRSLKLAPTKEIGYDEKQKVFYLICDNPACKGARMVSKEGDELGIEPIRARLEMDEKISRQLLELKGVPKVLLRNSVPVEKAKEFVDDYEATPMYSYERDEKTKKIKIIETPWIVDYDGVPSYSLLPAAVALSLIKQVAKILI
jgi:adenylate kinase family enzyme